MAKKVKRQTPFRQRIALNLQVFLLNRKMAGPMGNFVMTIRTTRRINGGEYTIPVGYQYDDDGSVIAVTRRDPQSNWYKNTLKTRSVALNIKGETYQATGTPVENEEERQYIFGLYKRDKAESFHQFFGLPIDSPEQELQNVLAGRDFMRFTLKK